MIGRIMRSFERQLLAEYVADARQCSFDLVSDLSDEQLIGPKLPTLNPMLWEIGHATWFQEKWVLRHAAGREPILPGLDSLYDSIGIVHNVRWDLPMLPRSEIFAYLSNVRDEVLELLHSGELTEDLVYFLLLSVFHEDMHTEAYTYARQTLAYPEPRPSTTSASADTPDHDESDHRTATASRANGDVIFPGGSFELGARQDEPFVFDNEKWAHAVEIQPFAISRAAVTQQQFAAFVEDDGYVRREIWCDDGWKWRESNDARHPVYWKRRSNGDWLRRHFDKWLLLENDFPVIHVNWYEAQAYCRWSQRRLPTEVEWEAAASSCFDNSRPNRISGKAHFPWGEEADVTGRANMDWQALGPVDVHALAGGDSPIGCRQMIGNVWEWTATTLEPFPGFSADPYKEYSMTSFGHCKVLRGGCWTTRSRMIRNTWRNYYRPDRRDVFAGFRTCALALED